MILGTWALFFLLLGAQITQGGDAIRWPAPPATPIVTLTSVIDVAAARPKRGLWARVGSWIGGDSEREKLSAPFDLAASGDTLWMTCTETPGLVRLNWKNLEFEVFECSDLPVVQPVCVAVSGELVLLSDSERGVVYRLSGGDGLEVWLDKGLQRPTGIAIDETGEVIWVADTASHQIVEFDGEGHEVRRIGKRDEGDAGLNFPTFLAVGHEGGVIVNDTLNYRIKGFGAAGSLTFAFGEEGRGAGSFERAKGVAVARDGRVIVADGMKDSVQIFDLNGNVMVQVGAQGEAPGMFWSPAGVAVLDDLVFVADTYNHRVQVLRLADGEGAP